MIHDSASTPDRIKRLTNICLWKVKNNMYRLYSVLNGFAVHFACQAQLGAHGCQKLFWLIQHSSLTLFLNWTLQTFLRKKIYCFKFATIMKGMFRGENQTIVPQAAFITSHQTCKSLHSRESKTFLDSAADSRFRVLDSRFCQWNLDSWFQSLVEFRIP